MEYKKRNNNLKRDCTIIKFNINHDVFVKLTDVGLKELEKQHNEVLLFFPCASKFEPPKTDKDGYSKWQLHVLMRTFGHGFELGCCAVPFETTIKLDVG